MVVLTIGRVQVPAGKRPLMHQGMNGPCTFGG